MKTLRQTISTGGVGNGTGWHDMGFKHNIAAAAITTNVETLLQIVLPPTADAADQPAAATPIARLYGAYLVFLADFAAQTTLTFAISVRRAGVQLGSANTFGWLNGAGGGTPAFTAFVPVALPALTANANDIQDGGAGPYFVNLLAKDVITLNNAGSSSVSQTACMLELSIH